MPKIDIINKADKFDIILWDVDQTLLDFKRSEKFAIMHCFELFQMTATDEIVELYSQINDRYWKQIEKGEIERKDALIGRFQTLFEILHINDVDPVAFQVQYADALGSVYYFLDHSYELVKRLKGKYRQYLVTNGITKTQTKKLQLSGLDKLVEGIFISEQMGAPKPQKAYFDKCFSLIPDFDAKRTILVGDSLTSDMLGGNNAGIMTCWYNPNGLENNSQAHVDYEIKNLNDILSILQETENAESIEPKA